MTGESREGGRAYVVFDALGVDLGVLFRDSERAEERHDDGVTVLTLLSELAAGIREENGPVGLDADVAFALQPCQRPVDRDVSHAQAAGQVDDARLALGRGKVGDCLHIILGGLRGVLPACLLQTLGLKGGRTDRLGGAGSFLHAPKQTGTPGLDKSRTKCSKGYIMYSFLRTARGGGAFLALASALLAADKARYTLFDPVPAEMLREMSTDRPDQTESPYTVDAGHLQLELDFIHYTSDREGEVRVRDLSVAPLNLKLGLTHRLDLQLMVDPYVESRTDDLRGGRRETVSGFGDVTTRLKFNVWGNDGGTTAFALMPFVKWPLSASEVRNGETEGGIIAILGYSLPAGWSSAVMTEVDWVSDGTGGRDVEWLNSITFSREIAGNLGGYIEFVAVVGDAPGFRWQGQVDAGLTYGLSDNVQLDAGCNFGITRSAPDYQPFVGVSRRF